MKPRYVMALVMTGFGFVAFRTLWLKKPLLEALLIFAIIAVVVYFNVKPRKD